MGLLTNLQSEIAEHLRTVPGLAGDGGVSIPVITEDHKDLESELERAMGKVGAGITVLVPEWAEGAEFGRIDLTIDLEIVERPSVNRGPAGSKITSTRIAELVWGALRNWRPNEEFAPFRFVSAKAPGSTNPVIRVIRFTTSTFDPELDLQPEP